MTITPEEMNDHYFHPDIDTSNLYEWEYDELFPGPFQGPHQYIPDPIQLDISF